MTGLWEETSCNRRRPECAVERYDVSPVIYYKSPGEANLYNTERKAIVYADLKETSSETDQLGQYIEHVKLLCHATEIQNWTDCSHFYEIAKDRFNRILKSKELLKELIGHNQGATRNRRGILNFVGKLSKILVNLMCLSYLLFSRIL